MTSTKFPTQTYGSSSAATTTKRISRISLPNPSRNFPSLHPERANFGAGDSPISLADRKELGNQQDPGLEPGARGRAPRRGSEGRGAARQGWCRLGSGPAVPSAAALSGSHPRGAARRPETRHRGPGGRRGQGHRHRLRSPPIPQGPAGGRIGTGRGPVTLLSLLRQSGRRPEARNPVTLFRGGASGSPIPGDGAPGIPALRWRRAAPPGRHPDPHLSDHRGVAAILLAVAYGSGPGPIGPGRRRAG